jgi:hypothetical protein
VSWFCSVFAEQRVHESLLPLEIVQLLSPFESEVCVAFTAERFQKSAGGKRSATTGLLKRI